MTDIFIQKISLIRKDMPPQDFDLSFLKESIYIETMDLSGPRLVLRMYDPSGYLKDFLGIKPKEVLELTLEDIWGEDEVGIKVRFVVMTMPINGPMIEFNCFEQWVEMLKRPAVNAMLFTRKPVETIIKRLLPGLKYNIAKFPTLNDYHILPGVRPSKILRQLAHEQAAAIWICRGTVYCQPFKALRAQKPSLAYYHQSRTEINQVLTYNKPSGKAVLSDFMDRNYTGWDMAKGIVDTLGSKKKPAEMVAQITSLDNLLVAPEPLIDFTVFGNGSLRPGVITSLHWRTDNPEAPIDESLPPSCLLGTVAHYYAPQRYFCRVKGIR